MKNSPEFNQGRRRLVLGGLALSAAYAAGGLSLRGLQHLFPNNQPTLPDQQPLKPSIQAPSKKEIIGYVPHWVINQGISDSELRSLTTLAYFGLPFGGDGNIVKDNPGYQTLQSNEASALFDKAKKNKLQLMLTATLMTDAAIASLVGDKDSRQRAVVAIVEQQKRYNMDSINVDFEYWGAVTPELRSNFSSFVEELRNRADARVSVAVYASSAINEHMYDISKLAVVSDGLVVMAYDFYRDNAKKVAPTAPLRGFKEGRYWYDVATSMEDFASLAPSEKIILGIPQYGYDYPVFKDGEMAVVRPSFVLSQNPYVEIVPETVTMGLLRERLKGSSQVRTGWDDIAKVRWWAYLDEYDILRMAYMEDERSVADKCDLVLAQNLGGVAFWASGFNRDDESVARVLRQKFS